MLFSLSPHRGGGGVEVSYFPNCYFKHFIVHLQRHQALNIISGEDSEQKTFSSDGNVKNNYFVCGTIGNPSFLSFLEARQGGDTNPISLTPPPPPLTLGEGEDKHIVAG